MCVARRRNGRAAWSRSGPVTTATSSSESVRSGDWNDEVERDRLPPVADLLAAVDVEDARLAELGPAGLARGGDERAGLDVLGDDDGDVLPVGRDT